MRRKFNKSNRVPIPCTGIIALSLSRDLLSDTRVSDPPSANSDKLLLTRRSVGRDPCGASLYLAPGRKHSGKTRKKASGRQEEERREKAFVSRRRRYLFRRRERNRITSSRKTSGFRGFWLAAVRRAEMMVKKLRRTHRYVLSTKNP